MILKFSFKSFYFLLNRVIGTMTYLLQQLRGTSLYFHLFVKGLSVFVESFARTIISILGLFNESPLFRHIIFIIVTHLSFDGLVRKGLYLID